MKPSNSALSRRKGIFVCIENSLSWWLGRVQSGLVRRIKAANSYFHALVGVPMRLPAWGESRRIQHDAFRQLGYDTCKKMVIFFIPGYQGVTGGTLQIFTLHRLTRELFKDKETEALICWIPGEAWDLHHFGGFKNDVTIFPFEMVLNSCRSDCELMFHLPEYAAMRIVERIGWQRLAELREKRGLKINILNQNIEVMLDSSQLDKIKEITPELTCTAGNPAWATESERQRLNIPIHVLPTWYYPDDAPWQPFESKKNLIIVSPDKNPYRNIVLGTLRNALPELEIKVIQDLKYEEYLEFEKSAKWSLTFGEGLDGYFYGPVLRGGVSFAVRNCTFDLPDLEAIRTVYKSYDIMAARIAEDIRALNNKEAYEGYNNIVREPLVRVLGSKRTFDSLAAFYRGELSLL